MGKVIVEIVFYYKKYLRVIVKYNGRRTYKTKRLQRWKAVRNCRAKLAFSLDPRVICHDTIRGCKRTPVVARLSHTIGVQYWGNIADALSELKGKALAVKLLESC